MAGYKDMLSGWHQGLLALDSGDHEAALRIFSSVCPPDSRIFFNTGCVHLARGSLGQALQAFDETLAKDACLAIGFFQRGVVHLRLGRPQEALSDCRQALTHLRSNRSIDYTQLGLKHKLHDWEVLHNTAAVQTTLGQWQAARECLEGALQQRPEVESPVLEAALAKVEARVLLDPIQLPDGTYFRPRPEKVAQLTAKVVLGKPKVISSVIPHDEYIGFEPLRPQKDGFYEPRPSAVGSPEAGYHRVQVHYSPPDSREVLVKAGSLVYVLQKVGDHATVIHDGKRFSLPTSLLQPVSVPKAEARSAHSGIPLPPAKQPPTRPNLRPAVDDSLAPKKENLPEDASTPSTSAKPMKELACQEAATVSAVQAEAYIREPRKETAVALQSAPFQGPPASSRVDHDNITDVALKSAESESKDSGKSENTPLEEQTVSNSLVVLNVHCSYTTSLRVRPDISLPDLQGLLQEKFSSLAGKTALQISCREAGSDDLKQVSGDEDLHEALGEATNGTSTLWCKGADAYMGRSVLYQMVALYAYPAEGPEDLQFEKGELLDILSEVNNDWLEGLCRGKTGIFPKCFAERVAKDKSN